jgi:hypothetical protein
MRRTALTLVLFLAGCGGQSAPAVALPDEVVDGWVYAITGASLLSPSAAPVPPPKPPAPVPGNACSNCGGTGKLPGDGRTTPTCPECNGTGKRTQPAPVKPKPSPAPAGQSCVGGACATPANTYQPGFRILRRWR